MIWFYSWSTIFVGLLDLGYILALALLCLAPFVTNNEVFIISRNKINLFAWSLVILVFISRFALVRTALWPTDKQAILVIALTRCVLHTIFLPLIISTVGLILVLWKRSESLNGNRLGRWVWTMIGLVILSLVFWIIRVFIKYGQYPCETPFP